MYVKKKFTSFTRFHQCIKQMHTKENWFLFFCRAVYNVYLMLLTVIGLVTIFSITHSFIPGLKRSFSANTPHHSLPVFVRTDCMDSPDFDCYF